MFPRFPIVALCLLLAGCAMTGSPPADEAPRPQAYRFPFRDGGQALYFVIDKGAVADRQPQAFLFVVPGSECVSMGPYLPQYFNGLDGAGGPFRIFILHKRFIEPHSNGKDCGRDFVEADHPSRWLADYSEFIAVQLQMARDNGALPDKVIVLGISEGGEVVPLLAHRHPQITHVAIFANGGMNPADSFRLQARRHGFSREAAELEAFCQDAPAQSDAAGRSCRYWTEMFALDHTANLLALDIPILVAMGEADQAIPPDSARFLTERFAAEGKTNLTALLIPGADHALTRNGISLLPFLWGAFDRWTLE